MENPFENHQAVKDDPEKDSLISLDSFDDEVPVSIREGKWRVDFKKLLGS